MLSQQEKHNYFIEIVKRIVKEEEYTIYTIVNVITGKKYVGLTGAFCGRRSNHKSLLRNAKHSNKELQKDYNIYKESAFTFKIEEYCNNKEVAKLTEGYYVEKLKSNNKDAVYNKKGFGNYKKEVMLDIIERYTKIIQRLLIIIEELQQEIKK